MAPATAGEFELVAKKLGLKEEEYATSVALRRWCENNANRCYIPERLLKLWGITVEPNST